MLVIVSHLFLFFFYHSDTHVRMLEDCIQETILEQNKLAAGSDRSVSDNALSFLLLNKKNCILNIRKNINKGCKSTVCGQPMVQKKKMWFVG